MKNLIKNEICGSVNSARMHCSRKTGQKLRLLYMNGSRLFLGGGGETRAKKKKRGKTQKLNAANATPYPNLAQMSIFPICSHIFILLVESA